MNLCTSRSTQRLSILLAVIALAVVPTHLPATESSAHIVIGPNASAMEQYAARELQRYLYQVSGTFLTIQTATANAKLSGPSFLLGRPDTTALRYGNFGGLYFRCGLRVTWRHSNNKETCGAARLRYTPQGEGC